MGVCVAAFYYVMNLRETNNNRKITATINLMQSLSTPEFYELGKELMNMRWSDFEDYRRKYDYTVNYENFTARMLIWDKYDIIGLLLKRGLIDIETLNSVASQPLTLRWMIFKPIIDEYRKFSYGKDAFSNWEYAAYELAKYKIKRDPTWKFNNESFTPEMFDKTFNMSEIR